MMASPTPLTLQATPGLQSGTGPERVGSTHATHVATTTADQAAHWYLWRRRATCLVRLRSPQARRCLTAKVRQQAAWSRQTEDRGSLNLSKSKQNSCERPTCLVQEVQQLKLYMLLLHHT